MMTKSFVPLILLLLAVSVPGNHFIFWSIVFFATCSDTHKRHSTPLEIAAEAAVASHGFKSADCVATFRFFADDLDFSEKDADEWSFLKTLLIEQWRFGSVMTPNFDSERSAFMSSAFQIVAPEMHHHFLESSVAELLYSVDSVLCREVFDTLLRIFDNCIDARERPNGYSILLRKFDESGNFMSFCEDLQMILKKKCLFSFDRFRWCMESSKRDPYIARDV